MNAPAKLDGDRPDPGPLYRPCVGIALLNPDGLVFVGRRRGEPAEAAHAWQMPQGGIDAGESPVEAALRELYEETNVPAGSVTLLGELEGWLSYDLPEEARARSWKGRFRGQCQKWVAFGHTGSEREIDIARPGGGMHKPEFDAWRWERLEATPDLIIPFKRAVYEAVSAAFSRWTTWRASP